MSLTPSDRKLMQIDPNTSLHFTFYLLMSLVGLWGQHTRRLDMARVTGHSAVQDIIVSFYNTIVADGFGSDVLCEDVFLIIARFLIPSSAELPVYLRSDDVFGFQHAIVMLAQVSRALVADAFCNELQKSILTQALTGATVATFRAGMFDSPDPYLKGNESCGEHVSSFFRSWMFDHADNSYLIEEEGGAGGCVRTYHYTGNESKDPEFHKLLAALDLARAPILTVRGQITVPFGVKEGVQEDGRWLEWTVPLPGWGESTDAL
jgi:hypothetical protein